METIYQLQESVIPVSASSSKAEAHAAKVAAHAKQEDPSSTRQACNHPVAGWAEETAALPL